MPGVDDKRMTHWANCYESPEHHECALAKIKRLERINGRYRAALELALSDICKPQDQQNPNIAGILRQVLKEAGE
jgi:hypothetical protein